MKKFIISSKIMKAALDKLGQAVAKKSVLPVLTNLLCRVGENEIDFYTTDLELTIKYRCECDTTGGPFGMLLPFEFLKKVVSLSKNVPVVVELIEGAVKITVTNDVYEINTLDNEADFPALPALPKKNFISINGSFIHCLNKALMTVSDDDLKPSLTKILLDIFTNGVKVVSTDAHCLFTQTFPVDAGHEEQLLISPKIAKALDGFDSTEIFWNKKHIGFHSNDITVIATRPEEKYPNYKGIIPEYTANLLLDREEVINALQRCCLTSNPTKATTILLKAEKGTIRFISEDVDLNRRIQVDINGSYDGPVDIICVGAQRLLTLMHQIDYDKVHFHIESQSKAFLISSENDPSFLSLMLPMSINN